MAKEVKLVKFMLHGREVTAPESTFEIAREHFGAELLRADKVPDELRKPLITPPKLPLIEKPVEIIKAAAPPVAETTSVPVSEPKIVPKPTVSRAKPKKK